MFGFFRRRTTPKAYNSFDKMAEELGEKGGMDVIRAPEHGSNLLYRTNPDAKSKGSLRWRWPNRNVTVRGARGEETVTREQRAALKNEWGREGALALLELTYAESNATKILEKFKSDYLKDLTKGEITRNDIYRLRLVKEQVLLQELYKGKKDKPRLQIKALRQLNPLRNPLSGKRLHKRKRAKAPPLLAKVLRIG